MKTNNTTHKRVAILGAGESGTGAALLAKYLGHSVFVSDKSVIEPQHKEKLAHAQIPFEENNHSEEKILNAQIIIKSPGIDPKKSDVLQKAKKHKIPIIGEIEFAAQYCTSKKIAITGSNGKTTTTMLVYEILKNGGIRVKKAGNIGNSFAEEVLNDLIYPDQKPEYYVLEVSSFMLDDMYTFRADVAILTNISPNHLDRYDYKMENYIASKFRIIQNMNAEGIFIYGIDSEPIEAKLFDIDTPVKELPFSIYPDDLDGACGDEQSMVIQYENNEYTISLKNASLKGMHNVYNMMAAALAGISVGVSAKSIEQTFETFEPAPHRMQHVLTFGGITFVNDSKATSVASAMYALATYNPVIWIAGGIDKGNDYTTMFETVKGRVKLLICLGKDNEVLKKAFKDLIPKIVETQSMHTCVALAFEEANPGDTVLLSPCCASHDLFKNYEERGNKFMEEVIRVAENIKNSPS